MNWFLQGLQRWSDLKGRASRAEYWGLYLLTFLAAALALAADLLWTSKIIPLSLPIPLLTSVVTLLSLVPAYSVLVRRLHDVGKSAWYILLLLIPIVGALIILYYSVKAGETSRNRYGEPVLTATGGKSGLGVMLGSNVREYGMFIALAVIMVIFSIFTNGAFLSSGNIANLLNQTGYIAVLAVGMTLVIVIKQIDLSVGFLAGFVGAIAAVSMEVWMWPVWFSIPLALVVGTLSGLLTGLLVSKLGIPSFVASLAGWLIFRGALLLVTSSTGTIIISNEFFNALGNGYIPDLPLEGFLPEVHKLTWLIGLVSIFVVLYNDWAARANRVKYGFEVTPLGLWLVKAGFITAVLVAITSVMAGDNGLSWTFVIMMVVMLVYHYIAENTILGRHIYAVGGNSEAAELSGISVNKITLIVFGSMGFLSAISGILFASRLQSATPTAGTLFELDAIAAAYIGGVSSNGGVGKITFSLIGALVYMSLMNGMNLMGTDQAMQYIIRGAVLALAVVFDVATRKVKR